MAWFCVLLAGIFEVIWAFYMKQSEGFSKLTPSVITIVTMFISFGLLAYAMRTLPLGTAYMVWTGIGAIGSFIVGYWLLGEPATLMRVVAALLILCGILLMKFSS
jgi:quaternary ammonium compound-resistance protein SugE